VPKSRGRPPGRGKPKNRRQGPVRELSLLEQILRSAANLDRTNVLAAEHRASGWLGDAWVDAPLGERDAEQKLCAEIVAHVSVRPSAAGLTAVAALRRVAPESAHVLLDEAIKTLAQLYPAPLWLDAPPFEPARGWRGVNVWDSERVLFVEFQSHDRTLKHTLMAHVYEVGGTMVESIELLAPDATHQWARLQTEPGVVPMPLVDVPVAEVLADVAQSLRRTDMVWPRHDEEYFVETRALAWARCRAYLADWPDIEGLTDEERDELIEAFVAEAGLVDDDGTATTSLADLFLTYGDGYLHAGPFGWSPDAVGLFMIDWLPRKATLDAEERAALPEALRRWLRFALNRRGVEQEWIDPVVAAVDEFLPAFNEAFDDEAAWGPAKQVAAELAASGIDITDRPAVEQAMRGLNAERLARQLADPYDLG
jgi:hypothetical protein